MKVKISDLLRSLDILLKVKGGILFKESCRLYIHNGHLIAENINKTSSVSVKTVVCKVAQGDVFKESIVDTFSMEKVLKYFDGDIEVTITNSNRFILIKAGFELKVPSFNVNSSYPKFDSSFEEEPSVQDLENPITEVDYSILKTYSTLSKEEVVTGGNKFPHVCIHKKMRVTDTASLRTYRKDFNFPFPIFLNRELINVLQFIITSKYSIKFYSRSIVISDGATWLSVARDKLSEKDWLATIEGNLPVKEDMACTETITLSKNEISNALQPLRTIVSKNGTLTLNTSKGEVSATSDEGGLSIPLVMVTSGTIEDKIINMDKLKSFIDHYEDSIVIYTGLEATAPLFFENEVEDCVLTCVG